MLYKLNVGNWSYHIACLCINLWSLQPPFHGHVTLPREFCTECFKRTRRNVLRVVKCCISYLLFIFIFLNPYSKVLNLLLMQSKGFDGRITRLNCWQPTLDAKMTPNLDKVDTYIVEMLTVKQLGSNWNLVKTFLDVLDTIMSELAYKIGRTSTSIGDKWWNKVTNLAKYVHLQEVGTF
jgi:hypothetical protein